MMINSNDADFSDTNLALPGNEPETFTVNLSQGNHIKEQWPDDGQSYARYIQ